VKIAVLFRLARAMQPSKARDLFPVGALARRLVGATRVNRHPAAADAPYNFISVSSFD